MDMSVDTLLNKDDAKPAISHTPKNLIVDSQDHERQKLEFLDSLNADLNKLIQRDETELDYQDWKFINLQEFELINEWNSQSRTLLNTLLQDGDKNSFFAHFDSLQKNWHEYLPYQKYRKESLLKGLSLEKSKLPNYARKTIQFPSKYNTFSAPLEEEHEPEIEPLEGLEESEPLEIREDQNDEDYIDEMESKNEGLKKKKHMGTLMNGKPSVTANKLITLNSDRHKIVRELIKMCNKNKITKARKRRFTNVMIVDYINLKQNIDTRRNNAALAAAAEATKSTTGSSVSPPPDVKHEESIASETRASSAFPSSYSMPSSSPVIPDTDTTHTVTDGSKLIIKITLKQYHVRQLKRLQNEIKRKQKEKERAERNKKRSRDGNTENDDDYEDDNDVLDNDKVVKKHKDNHGLPTYDLDLTAKEARAIQRHYDNTYFMIWKDMARKDSAKIAKLVQQLQSVRLANFKKTSSLCAREAKKWQSRNFKQVKDFQTRARRGIREMSSYWKKNEREERDLKKKAEKIALEQAKKEEEERENKRQAKKLNFLLTQTELYSHFIGSKIKTNEFEKNMQDTSIASTATQPSIDLTQTKANKNDFHSIDFDNEDDEQLRLKAAENASNVLAMTRAKTKKFDDETSNGEELNFQNPSSLGEITISQPKMLACTLKEYQLKGLNWLANLYDQGINGILADEMGLGKTVQSISVLAHLAERHNIWGPFLVVTPASTLHNWVNEISKFVPNFKILPYWGNGSDRKILRRFWDRKNLRYNKDSPFHIMVTSYQMVVSDSFYLQKMKWQYMILDEAQAIKSSQSSRWKNLLSFHCRNRLLLTGTPIQNSMQELWALLHFIMPSLFDSHDEFSDWFSKDIEAHAESNAKLNQQQLRRLHMILKPFMLRRVKKNVQSELGDKIEIDVMCDLTQRQARLYQVLKSQVSTNYDAIENAVTTQNDLLSTFSNTISGNSSSRNATGPSPTDQNLINAVMQFRKVCNHPDLFERAEVNSPFSFCNFGKTYNIGRDNLGTNTTNNSSFNLAGTGITGSNGSSNQANLGHPITEITDVSYSTSNCIHYKLPKLIYQDIILPNYTNTVGLRRKLLNKDFSIFDTLSNRDNLERLSTITGYTIAQIQYLAHQTLLMRLFNSSDDFEEKYDSNKNLLIYSNDKLLQDASSRSANNSLSYLLDVKGLVYKQDYLNSMHPAYHPGATAPPVTIEVMGDKNFSNRMQNELFNPVISQAFSEIPVLTQYNMLVHKKIPLDKFPKTGLNPTPLNKYFSSYISMPSMDTFISESAKLKKLDQLLVQLKEGGHRVLIYFQMTKMMDLMEEYLTYKQYNHIRLDGSSKLDDRRDLVHDWQTRPEIFVFLLSTRAGGLGINLTAADTVIFYDSDWNPTIDSQAMDRAHRLGQTRQVTVYRLLVRGTIEERMRDRAKQKEHVQQVVMEGKTQENGATTIETMPQSTEVSVTSI